MPNQAGDLLSRLQRELTMALAFAGVLSLFIAVLHLIVPLFMLQVFDRVLTSRNMDTLTMLFIVAMGGLVVFAVLEFIRGRVQRIGADRLAHGVGEALLARAVADAVDNGAEGGAQAIRDLSEVRGFVASTAFLTPFELLWAPVFLTVLFFLHPTYGWFAVAAAGVLTVFSLIVEIIGKKPLGAAADATIDANAEAGQLIRHAEPVLAMGMLPALTARWKRSQVRAMRLFAVGTGRVQAISALSKAVRLALQIGMLATGVTLVIANEASPGSMIAAAILMGRTLQPFEQLIDGWRHWVLAGRAYRRVRAVIDGGSDTGVAARHPAPAGALSVEQLMFMPPGTDRPILKAVSFQLAAGEALGVIGPSAAGKSTLARMLMGLITPTAGGVYLDGHRVDQWDPADRGRYFGYLPQNVALLRGTVRENICRFSDADPRDVVDAAHFAGIHDLIGRLPFGYETDLGDGNHNLSGGQRQRVALARAVFGNPKLLVLDEPNSNLDAAGEEALVQAIETAKRRGMTVVLIAHRPSLMRVVDKVLVLVGGTVDRFGPKDEIVAATTMPVAPEPDAAAQPTTGALVPLPAAAREPRSVQQGAA